MAPVRRAAYACLQIGLTGQSKRFGDTTLLLTVKRRCDGPQTTLNPVPIHLRTLS